MKVYQVEEWGLIQHESYDPDKRLYVDLEGNYITGILKDFSYYGEGDPRNDRYVENGVPQPK
jgi:hypothetical protein